jgi:hypothetical protein
MSKKSGRRKRPTATQTVRRAPSTSSMADDMDWEVTRHGARAGRGFTFQHLIGAWIAAGIDSETISGVQLTPEGLEDLSVEGPVTIQIQVKSRIDRRGAFSPREAAAAIVATWIAHKSRSRPSDQLAVIFENDIDDCPLPRDLGDVCASLPNSSVLCAKVRSVAAARGYSSAEADEICSTVWVMALSWADARKGVLARLGLRNASTPSGVLSLVSRELEAAVQTASAENASRTHDQRSALSRTYIASLISRTIELADVSSLQAALHDGICEPLNATPQSDDGARYYRGIGTQPSHVAAGLVVPSDEINNAVLSGCVGSGAVVLHGPSGVGKSAALWSLPNAAPGVLWFRVRRLLPEDVGSIIRLIRAWGSGPDRPVGLLIDSAGTGSFTGWRDLRREAAAITGVYLVATARNEDLQVLGELRDCVTVEVVLTEHMAAQIFKGLVTSGSTSVAHWAEAFELSNGLTMEFTHLLTQGARLQQVVDDQISDRIHSARDLELEVLTICGVAGQWGASVPLDEVIRAVDASTFEARRAIDRLVAEHMLNDTGGLLTAMHSLRSTAITNAIHRTPPPHLRDSTSRTIPLLRTDDLALFTARALTATSDLDTVFIDAALVDARDIGRFVSYLHGLRAASFSRRAMRWVEIADSHSVSPAKQAYVFQFAVAGIDLELFPDEIAATLHEIATVQTDDLGARLLNGLDPAASRNLLANAALDELPQLLSELREARPEQVDALVSASREPDFMSKLSSADLEQISDIVSAAMTVQPRLGTALCESAGGPDKLLIRFATETPWILESDIRQGETGLIGYARQHEVVGQSDHAQAVAAGRRMLRLLPNITAVDVAVLLPGGHELIIGDYNHAATGLIRRNDITEREVSWNQERIIISVALIAVSDTTRLYAALGLLQRLVAPLTQVASSLVTGRRENSRQPDPMELIKGIGEEANNIGPAFRVAYTPEGKFDPVDDVSGFLTDITDNLIPRMLRGTGGFSVLAGHLRDNILGRSFAGIKAQRWYLIGLDSHPAALDEVEAILQSLYHVLYECGRNPASGNNVLEKALSARSEWALRRGADEARRLSLLAAHSQLRGFELVVSALAGATSLMRPRFSGSYGPNALTYEVETVAEWPKHLERLLAHLVDHADAVGHDIVVAPTCRGMLLPGMQVRILRGKAWPGPDLEEFRDALPPVAPSPLFDQVRIALDALSRLYTVRELPAPQLRIPSIAMFKLEARAALETAMKEIRGLPSDIVTNEVIRHLGQLSDQANDPTTPNIAASLVAGILFGSDNPLVAETIAALLVAMEWDMDREVAISLLVA